MKLGSWAEGGEGEGQLPAATLHRQKETKNKPHAVS